MSMISSKFLLVLLHFSFSHTVPPRIIQELSPSSVMCEKQTPCFLSCQVTSYIPLNFSWTKDGQVLTGANMKLLNNSVIVTPRNGRDYGDYVCHATNSFGSTEYKITLLAPTDNQIDNGRYSSSHSNAPKRFVSNILESLELSSPVWNLWASLWSCLHRFKPIYVSKATLCTDLIHRRCSVGSYIFFLQKENFLVFRSIISYMKIELFGCN